MRGAAADLCVTPGAVSQQVLQLEAWLGAPLLVRARRRLALTPEGSLLGSRLGAALDQVDDAIWEVRQALRRGPAAAHGAELRHPLADAAAGGFFGALRPTCRVRMLVEKAWRDRAASVKSRLAAAAS